MAEENEMRINLEGALMFHRLRTEDVFKVRLDVTPLVKASIYNEVADYLRNLLTTIDTVWSERAVERKITRKDIFVREDKKSKVRVTRNVIEFLVIPSAIANSIKYLRTLVYDALNKYAVKIPLREDVSGGARRGEYLYLVPKSLVPELMSEIRKINEIIDELNYIKGKISQKVKEGEEGKYSLQDYFSSPYWNELQRLIIAMEFLSNVSSNPAINIRITEEMKGDLLKVILEGGDVVEYLNSKVGSQTLCNALRNEYDKAVEKVNRIPKRIAHVEVSPLIVDLTPQKINEWVSMDPELGNEIRERARVLVKAMVDQLAREAEELVSEVREKAEVLIKMGGKARVVEELEDLNRKFEALGIGRFEEIDSIVNSLRNSEELTAEELQNMADLMSARISEFVGMEADYATAERDIEPEV